MSGVAGDAAPLRVVLADDTPDIRMLVRLALEMEGGFEVVGEAADGVAAVEVVQAHQPDIALVDLAMPVMDGLEVIPRIRSLSPATHIVVLSGFEPEAISADVLQLGAARYVQKGRPLRDLVGVLLEVAGRAAPAAPARRSRGSQADFVAEVVHELKNPLATVTGLSDTLVAHWDQFDDGRRLEIALAIKRQAWRAAALVDDLLSAARLDGGQVSIDARPLDLEALVRAAGDDRPIVVDADPVPSALADPLRVEQILVNLLDNAARYGAPPVVVGVRARGDDVLVTVRDHGPGVAPGDADHLFQRFSPLARGKEGSNGLGLYIARGLARAMGGDVTYEPAEPGASFALRLPVAPEA